MSVYPQARPFIPDDIAQFLAQPLVAKLSTHNQDGTIHTVPIWFRYHEGEFLFGTQDITQKVQNIRRDNRVTVLIETTDPNLKAIMAYGTATLDYADVIATRRLVFEKYMSAEDAAALAVRLADQWKPVIVRVKPERMVTFDYAQGFGVGAEGEGVKIV
jgi:PPOX class probable F420-dependent enzyme